MPVTTMKSAVHTIMTLALGLAGCAATGVPAPRGPDEKSAQGEAATRNPSVERPAAASQAAPAYPWLTVGRLYWTTDPLGPDLLVADLGGGRPPVRLTGDIAALKGFIAMQFNGRLPGVGALSDIAQLVKDAIFGKRGRIATPDFFDAQQLRLDDWFLGHDNSDRAEFARLCSGIRAALNKNAWTLQFNVFNEQGGVDVVRVSGTASPLTLQFITIDVVKPRGEFNYPLTG